MTDIATAAAEVVQAATRMTDAWAEYENCDDDEAVSAWDTYAQAFAETRTAVQRLREAQA